LGYGATLSGSLSDIHLDAQGHFHHPFRSRLEERNHLLQTMTTSERADEQQLAILLGSRLSKEAMNLVLLPLLRSYLLDPELLRRYNYGRGQQDAAVAEADLARVNKAVTWLRGLRQRGFTREDLQALQQEIPFVGPYASFSGYMEMLLAFSAWQGQQIQEEEK
jgi:hypothetical protein